MPNVIIVNTLGPIGPTGPAGSQGPSGSLAIDSSGSFGITGSLFISGSAPLVITGPAVITGSLNVTQGITGSLLGTATNALTASYTTNISGGSAGYVPLWKTDSTLGTSSIHQDDGNVGIGILLPEAKLHVKGPGSTDLYTSLLIQNSNGNPSFVVLGSGHVGIENLFPSYELDVTGTGRFTNGLLVTGSLRAPSITGSVEGTASNAVSSSYALTASYAANVPVTASYALSASVAVSSSYALNTTTASFATTASYIALAQTASYVLNAVSSSFSSTASYVLNAVSSSYAANASTASYVLNAVSSSFASTASFIALAQTASYILNAVSSSYALSASYLIGQSPTSSYALTASYLNPLNQDVSITGNLTINGTASISYLNVAYESASIIYSSGSNQLGDAANDTQTLYGTVIVPTGSLTVTGSLLVSGSSTFTNIGPAVFSGSITQNASTASFGGRVGIGTTSPSSPLHIKNSAASYLGGLILEKSDAPLTYNLYVDGNNSFAVSKGASQFFTIDQSGNVGIGTSSPAYKLQVNSTGVSQLTISSNNSNSDYAELRFLTNNGAWSSQIKNWQTSGGANQGLYIQSGGILTSGAINAVFNISGNTFFGNSITAASARVHILGSGATSSTTALLVQNSNASSSLAVLDNGNVGVGTTSPDAKLTVKTSITNGSGTPGLRVYGTTNYIGMEYDEGQGPTLNTSYSGTGGGSPGSYNFYSGSTVLATIGTSGVFAHNLNGTFSHYSGNGYLETWNGSSGDTSLVNVGNYNMRFLTNNTERVRITGGGNVGIGTTSPAYRLDVSGSGNFTNGLTVTGSLTATGGITGSLFGTSSWSVNALTASYALNAGDSVWTGSAGNIYYSGGNVGIGTSTPTASLHISGSSNSVLLEIDSPAVNNILLVSGSGNVGFSTTPLGYRITAGDPNSSIGGTIAVRAGSSVSMGYKFYQDSLGEVASINYEYGDALRINSVNQPIINSISGTERTRLLVNGNFGINESTPTARLQVKGSGTTSSTTALLVQNANASASLAVLDNGNVGIGTASPSSKLYVQDTGGSGATHYLSFRNDGNDYGGIKIGSSGQDLGIQQNGGYGYLTATGFYIGSGNSTIWTNNGSILDVQNAAGSTTYLKIASTTGNVGIGTASPAYKLDVSGSGNFTNGLTVTGSLSITRSAGTGSALYAYKSGSTVVDIQGSQGQLFSVIDTLSGSLMSVNDISGLPILEVFSDDRVVMGTYGAPALIITGSNAVFTGSVIIDGAFLDTVRTGSLGVGSTLLYTINTGSYTAGFFDYFINSGSNYRAGNIMAVFGAGTYKFTDLATPDIGSTTNLQFSMSMAGASAQLYASASSAGWTVKTTFRTI